jgi:hypothetical protein
MNLSRHPNNIRMGVSRGVKAVFACGLLVLLVACEDKAPLTFGHAKDISDDLYHRLRAGLFVPVRDPVILQVFKNRAKAPGEILRVTWERGSFQVKTDRNAHLVVFMDREAISSHVNIAGPDYAGMALQFRSNMEGPIK